MIETGLVSTEWLAAHLTGPRLKVVDGSMYLPTSGRDAAAEHRDAHIPGAVFFDVEATSDRDTPLPHMLPSAAAFSERMRGLGLNDEDDIVAYDGSGVNLSAGRLWWMFRLYGHPRVAVLDGGMRKWVSEGRPVERGIVAAPRGNFTAREPEVGKVRKLAEVLAAIGSDAAQIVDMRSAGRFAGTEPEPRAGLRGGHIPGSRNLPFNELVGEDGTILPRDALRRRLAAAGVDPGRAIIATCGSGVSACALAHALHLLGHDQVALYDGAWSEWGGRDDTPIAREPE